MLKETGFAYFTLHVVDSEHTKWLLLHKSDTTSYCATDLSLTAELALLVRAFVHLEQTLLHQGTHHYESIESPVRLAPVWGCIMRMLLDEICEISETYDKTFSINGHMDSASRRHKVTCRQALCLIASLECKTVMCDTMVRDAKGISARPCPHSR